jgi:hypothetical protein
MARLGSVYELPRHEVAYGIFKRAAKWPVRNWMNKDHHTGNSYLDKSTKNVLGEMSGTRTKKLCSLNRN